MKYLKSKQLFENKEHNYIYIVDNLDYYYFTNDITIIPFLIEDSIEDNIKNIKPVRNYYLNDKHTQYFSFNKQYHPSVGNNGWLEKTTPIYKISGEKITDDDFQILYLCSDNGEQLNPDQDYMILTNNTTIEEIELFVKQYIDDEFVVYKADIGNYYIIETTELPETSYYSLTISENIKKVITEKNLNKYKI